MKIGFYGSSLLSAYWNGAATYYRGLIRALSLRGHAVTFFEPDAFGRQAHADMGPPDWCRVEIYDASAEGLSRVVGEAQAFDVVVKASGVGIFDEELPPALLAARRPGALFVFWDVDAPATLATLEREGDHPMHGWLGACDMVLTYGGGAGVVARYETLGARACHPVYNALDPHTHYPVSPVPRYKADLGFLGNRLPDREARVDAFPFEAARLRPERTFLLGGAGWEGCALPPNLTAIGYVRTSDHNAFNASTRAVLNISRQSMAEAGYAPATRVFEAAGAGACLITDDWPGIDAFLAPGTEILVARDGREVAELLDGLTPARAAAIGAAARRRIRRDHTYERRAERVEALLAPALAKREAA
ncbi:MAG: glycosyltransferase [Alphaproteobacteria bacterium]|nr:glycosyltransferase [Alphaproteobacteria bacterium]